MNTHYISRFERFVSGDEKGGGKVCKMNTTKDEDDIIIQNRR